MSSRQPKVADTSSKKKIITIKPKAGVTVVKLKKIGEVDKHKQNLRIIMQYSNATPIRTKGSLGYACAFCNHHFSEASELKQHTLVRHTDSKDSYMDSSSLMNFFVKLDISFLQCKLCLCEIDTLETLMSHLKDVHSKNIAMDIKNQIVPFRFESEQLSCVVCKKGFNNFKILLEHMNLHYNNYMCEVCGSGFVCRKILLSHSYRHKTGRFKCDYCSKIFNTKIKMQEHQRAVHICLNKRSRCGYCGEKFSDYAKKNEHEVKVHGAKPNVLKCQACEKVFHNQRALTTHTKTYHLMERRTYKPQIR